MPSDDDFYDEVYYIVEITREGTEDWVRDTDRIFDTYQAACKFVRESDKSHGQVEWRRRIIQAQIAYKVMREGEQ